MDGAATAVDNIFILFIGINLIFIGVLALILPFIPMLKGKSTKLNRGLTVVAGIAMIVYGSHLSMNFFNKDQPNSVEAALAIAAESKNKETPVMIAEDLRLESVTSEGKKVIYNATLITYSAAQIDKEKLFKLYSEDLINRLCPNEGLQSFLREGASFQYNYYGKDGQFITSAVLSSETCDL